MNGIMKNGKKGFSLTEVIVAMAVIAIISSVVITAMSSSSLRVSKSAASVLASSEAESMIENYIKGSTSNVGFIDRVGLSHLITPKERMAEDVMYLLESDREADTYTFYYDNDFRLLSVPQNEHDGTCEFRLSFRVGNGLSVDIVRLGTTEDGEKPIYNYTLEDPEVE